MPAGLTLRWPIFSRAELLFALKCFAAAMLAFGVASWAGLPRPFWAMMTSYIVANPLAGAVRSKAVFRLMGTVIGSAMAVWLVPSLAHAPVLLSVALSAWVAFCLYISLLDRTPRSYIFMLAGYTAALIGFPAVDSPVHIFDSAVARVEEIGLGIVSASLVHGLLWPVSLQPTVTGLVEALLRDTRRWIDDLAALAQQSDRSSAADRRKVAGDLAQLRMLATHVPFDTSHLRWTGDALHHIQEAVAGLTAHLSALEDRLHGLIDHHGHLPADVGEAVDSLHHWVAQTESVTPAEPLHWPDLATAATSEWDRALRLSLATHLHAVQQGWLQAQAARRDFSHSLDGVLLARARGWTIGQVWQTHTHVDHAIAALSGLAAFVAIAGCCGFWIQTGWAGGSAAAMMAAVFCSLFASLDDPVPAIQGFLKWTVISMPISALYVLCLLPLVSDMVTLAAVCLPLLMILGAFIARPATMGKALPVTLGVLGIFSLRDTSAPDLVNFANSMLGQIVGVVAAGFSTGALRSLGADHMVARIRRHTRRELATLARSTPRKAQRLGQAYVPRALDRVAQLTPRLALAGAGVTDPADMALRDLRLGGDILALQAHRSEDQPSTQRVLQAVADWLHSPMKRPAEATAVEASPVALPDLDAALRQALAATPSTAPSDPSTTEAVAEQIARVGALVGLRRAMYPQASWGEPGLTAAGVCP